MRKIGTYNYVSKNALRISLTVRHKSVMRTAVWPPLNYSCTVNLHVKTQVAIFLNIIVND